jgi:hypothetical protein
MKKLLMLLIAAIPMGLLAVEKPAEKIAQFLDMEKKHKKDWHEYKKEMFRAKMEMVHKHKEQMFDMKKKHIIDLAKGTKSDALLNEKLKDMVALHEQENAEWKAFHENECKKGSHIGARHDKELADFKKSLR